MKAATYKGIRQMAREERAEPTVIEDDGTIVHVSEV